MFLPRMFVIHMVGRVKDKNIEAKYVYDEYKAKSADANWILHLCKHVAWLLGQFKSTWHFKPSP